MNISQYLKIHLPVNRHLDCLQFLAITSKAAVNSCIEDFMGIFTFIPFGSYLEVKWLNCVISVCITL